MLSLITAVDKNGLIGNQGKLPWHLPAELKFFRENTLGTTVIMGRKTFDSIGKPLSGRENVVVTRDPHWSHEGVGTLHTVEEALALAEEKEVMVAGGREIYELFMPFADFIIQSVVEGDFVGDTYFPEIDAVDWALFTEYYYEGFLVRTWVRREAA